MNRMKFAVLLPGSLLLLGLAACGGGSAGSSAASRPSAAQPARDASGAAGAAGSTTAGQAPAPASASDKGTAESVIPNLTVPEGPRVQRSGRISLQVADGRFDNTLSEVSDIVTAAGGYTAGTDAQAPEQGDRLRSGTATFQVPAARFDDVLNQVRRKGTPESISISGTDVSSQYVDLQARERNAEAQRDAFLALMRQARTVAETIQIQNQLGQITAQIEQLKGQIDYLDHSTAFATLSVRITEDTAGPADEWGLQSALTQAEHNLVGILAFLILAVVTLAPVLVAAAILLLIGRAAWRRWGQRPAVSAPAPLAE
jgi:Domain of unknown function (DUF4349)